MARGICKFVPCLCFISQEFWGNDPMPLFQYCPVTLEGHKAFFKAICWCKYHAKSLRPISWVCTFLMTPWVTPSFTRQRLVNTKTIVWWFLALKGLVNYEKASRQQNLAMTKIEPKLRIEANRLKHVIAQPAAVLCNIKLNANTSLITW